MAGIVETILRYKIDSASLNDARQSVAEIDRQTREYKNSLQQITPTSRDADQSIGRFWENAGKGAQSAAQQARRYIEELLKARNAQVDTSDATAALPAATPSNAAGVQRGISSLAQIAGANLNSGSGVGSVINTLAGNIAQLGVAGGVAGVALLAVKVAFSEFSRQLEASKAQLNSALQVNTQYYDALEQLTSDQVRQQIEALQQSRVVLEQQAEQLRSNLEGAFAEAQRQVGDAGARALFATGAFASLEEAVKSAEGELSQNEQLTGRLTQALEGNAFALNDSRAAALAAAESERQLAQQRIAILDDQVRRAIETRGLIRTATAEQVESRRAALEDERAVVEQAIQGLQNLTGSAEQQEAARAALERYQQQLQRVNEQLAAIDQFIRPAVAAREAEQNAIDAQRQALERLKRSSQQSAQQGERFREQQARDVERQREIVATAQSRISDIQERGAADILRIQEELRQRETQLTEAYTQRQADIVDKARGAEREALIEAERKRVKILRQASEQELEAVGNRDALALVQARRGRDEQLRDLQEDTTNERRKRQEALSQQIEDSRRTYSQQLNDARRAAQEQIRTSQQRVSAEIAAQRQVITTAQSAINTRVNLERGAYNALGNAVVQFVTRVNTAAAALAQTSAKTQAAARSSVMVTVNQQSNNQAIQALNKALRGGA